MCKFGDVYLGTTSSGLFRICGKSDNGTYINAIIKTGITDFNIASKKQFRAFYFSGEADGNIKVTAYADGIAANSITVSPRATGIFDDKITIPFNVKARYWQIKIENVDGSFFVLYEIKGLPIILHPGRLR